MNIKYKNLNRRIPKVKQKNVYHYITIQKQDKETSNSSQVSFVTLNQHPFVVVKQLHKDGYNVILLFYKEINKEEYKYFVEKLYSKEK